MYEESRLSKQRILNDDYDDDNYYNNEYLELQYEKKL